MKEKEMIDAGGPHEGNSVVHKSRERKCSVFHMGTWPNNSSVIFMAVSSLRNFPCFGLTCPNLGLWAQMKIQGKFSHTRVRPIKRTNELSFFLFVFFFPSHSQQSIPNELNSKYRDYGVWKRGKKRNILINKANILQNESTYCIVTYMLHITCFDLLN